MAAPLKLDETHKLILTILANSSVGPATGSADYVDTTYMSEKSLFHLVKAPLVKQKVIDRLTHDNPQAGNMAAKHEGRCIDQASFEKYVKQLVDAGLMAVIDNRLSTRIQKKPTIDLTITQEGARAINDEVLAAAFAADSSGHKPDYMEVIEATRQHRGASKLGVVNPEIAAQNEALLGDDEPKIGRKNMTAIMLNPTQTMALRILANQSRGLMGEDNAPYVETTHLPFDQLHDLIRVNKIRVFNIDRLTHSGRVDKLFVPNPGICTDEKKFMQDMRQMQEAGLVREIDYRLLKNRHKYDVLDFALTKKGAEAIGDVVLAAAFDKDKEGKLPTYTQVIEATRKLKADLPAAEAPKEEAKEPVKKKRGRPAKKEVTSERTIEEILKTPEARKTAVNYVSTDERKTQQEVDSVLNGTYRPYVR